MHYPFFWGRGASPIVPIVKSLLSFVLSSWKKLTIDKIYIEEVNDGMIQ